MSTILPKFITEIFEKCGLIVTEFDVETEGISYAACHYKLNGEKIYCRNAKNTPKKEGQFVTFWKRNNKGITAPFCETDTINYLVVIVQKEQQQGLFIFPKEVLTKQGILTTNLKEGKRGFRVYPIWDITKSKQAAKTQQWQSFYFYDTKQFDIIEKISALFASK